MYSRKFHSTQVPLSIPNRVGYLTVLAIQMAKTLLSPSSSRDQRVLSLIVIITMNHVYAAFHSAVLSGIFKLEVVDGFPLNNNMK